MIRIKIYREPTVTFEDMLVGISYSTLRRWNEMELRNGHFVDDLRREHDFNQRAWPRGAKIMHWAKGKITKNGRLEQKYMIERAKSEKFEAKTKELENELAVIKRKELRGTGV